MRANTFKLTGTIILVLTLSSLIAGAADETPVPTNRVIVADLKQIKGPRLMVWQDCIGAGRVGEGLRDGWRHQLEDSRREIGFKYLRMHGLLQDEPGVYAEERDGSPRYNSQCIDDVYDFLIGTGMKPFVGIGFMPSALSSGKPVSEAAVMVAAGGDFETALPLREDDVYYLSLTRE